MQRILLRHVTGTRANQVDEFESHDLKNIVAGRDELANVRFDADREDLVSRQHARIYADAARCGEFLLADMGSRNGTFLNRQRISGPTQIHHGDAIQLGAGGPEFRFEMDPPPAGAASRPTRVGMAVPEASRPIGRATVERMLDDTFGRVKRESGKTLWAGIAATVMIALVGVGTYLYMHHSSVENAKRLEDQQLLLLQMAQVVKQQPSDDAAVRAQMTKLSTDMKRIMAQNAALSRAATFNANGDEQSGGGQGGDYDAGLAQATRLYKANQFQDAYAECVRMIRANPNRWEGYYIAGLSAEALNSPQDAQQDYQYALAQAPEKAKATITERLNALQGGTAQQAN